METNTLPAVGTEKLNGSAHKIDYSDGYWALRYRADIGLRYCINGGGSGSMGNGTGNAEVTEDVRKARLFLTKAEAEEAVSSFAGWIVADIVAVFVPRSALLPEALVPPVTRETLQKALNRVLHNLHSHPNTDSSAAIRRFLWSLYNGDGYPNLYRLGCVLDARNSEALSIIFAGYMAGCVKENVLTELFEKSGEMKRVDEARKKAGGRGFEYPALPQSLIDTVQRQEGRVA